MNYMGKCSTKKGLGIFVSLLLVIGFSAIMFFLSKNNLTLSDVPKDVPVIDGEIVSIETFRSDEFKRGIEVKVKTNLSIPEVAQYYTDEFTKRGIRAFGLPTFQGNARDLEDTTDASGGGETKNHNQVMVYLFKSEASSTLVTTNVLGNSVLFLP